jgi:hypothetical protein
MPKLNKIERIEERLDALEKVNVLRGFGRATTDQAKAIRFVIKHQAALAELIEKGRRRERHS